MEAPTALPERILLTPHAVLVAPTRLPVGATAQALPQRATYVLAHITHTRSTGLQY